MPYYLGSSAELTSMLPANLNITGSSVPLTLGEVASIICEYEAELDGYAAAAGYPVPIATSATYAFATMQRQVKNGAGAAVLGILFPNMGGPGSSSTLADDYRRAYVAFVKDLRDKKIALVGAGSDGGEDGRVLPRAGSAASSVVSLDWEP